MSKNRQVLAFNERGVGLYRGGTIVSPPPSIMSLELCGKDFRLKGVNKIRLKCTVEDINLERGYKKVEIDCYGSWKTISRA